MPRRRQSSGHLSPEAIAIERILREENLDLSSGAEAASLRPPTARALAEIADCFSIADLKAATAANEAREGRAMDAAVERAVRQRMEQVDW